MRYGGVATLRRMFIIGGEFIVCGGQSDARVAAPLLCPHTPCARAGEARRSLVPISSVPAGWSFFFWCDLMADRFSVHLFVSGRVQGVGFRSFSEKHAVRLGLAGYARNLSDGRVEIEVEGEKNKIEDFLRILRKGPLHSRVTSVDVTWGPAVSGVDGFSIRL
jgi:acylphosphatase